MCIKLHSKKNVKTTKCMFSIVFNKNCSVKRSALGRGEKMTPTNVVSMDCETKEAMEDFLKTYERDSPTLYPDAEMLLMIKTTETSCVGVSVYPNEEARGLAESRTSAKLRHLVKENFRLSGDMVVKHVFTNRGIENG